MRGFEQDQPPFYYSSESEWIVSRWFVAVAVIQNIRVDKSCWFHLVSALEAKHFLLFHNFFDLKWKESEMMCKTIKFFISHGIAYRPVVEASGVLLEKWTFQGYLFVGVDRGPEPPLPSPLPPFPYPAPPPLPPSSPTSLLLEYFSRPHRKSKKTTTKKQVTSSYNLSFQCMDFIKALRL